MLNIKFNNIEINNKKFKNILVFNKFLDKKFFKNT